MYRSLTRVVISCTKRVILSRGCRGDVARDLQLIRVLRALQIANLSVTGTKNIKILNVAIYHPKESKSLKAIFFN